MIGLLLAFSLLSAAPSSAQPPAQAGPQIVLASQRVPGVADPRAFVAATYARYQANPNVPPPDTTTAYSPRLKALFDGYDAWSRQHSDVVGALDFDWWANAQDVLIRNLRLTVRNEGRNRRWVIAAFDNYDSHEQVRFLFVRMFGRWCLDDAVQGTGRGDNGWTLSALLRRREE